MSEPQKQNSKNKQILYIDMDNVLVDFASAFDDQPEGYLDSLSDPDEIPGIFAKMKPNEGAIDSVHLLSQYYDIYILSTAPWENPSAWSDKLEWIKKYLPELGYKRLILSHNKHLNAGDYLIDDRLQNGAAEFGGEHIHFGQGDFLDWKSVTKYLLDQTK